MRRRSLGGLLLALPLLAGCQTRPSHQNADGIRVTLLSDESQSPVAKALEAHIFRIRVDAPNGVEPLAYFVLRQPGRADTVYGGVTLQRGSAVLAGFEPLFTKTLSDLKLRLILSGNGLTARNIIPCPLTTNQGFGAVGGFDPDGSFVVGQFGDRRLLLRFQDFKRLTGAGPGR